VNLDTHHQQTFREQGFLVFPRLLSGTDLDDLDRMANRLIDGELKPEIPYEGNTPPDFYTYWEPGMKERTELPRRRRIRQLAFMCYHHPYFRDFVRHRAIYAIVAELFGSGVQIFSDALFVKPPFGGMDAALHQDTAFWPKLAPNAINFWLAIDPATVENGCLHVIPGSHVRDLPHHKDPIHGWFLRDEEVDIHRQIPIELEPGGAIFFDTALMHRSYPNHSARGRRAMTMCYMSGAVRHIEPWRMNLIESYDLRYYFTPIQPV
jgi:hypothetical protein